MQTKLIITCTILAILLDTYIYVRIAQKGSKLSKRLYIVSIILIDGAILSALLFYRSMSNAESLGHMLTIMWLIFIFFANILSKAVYTVISLIDYPIRWFTKRRSRLFGRIGLVCGFAVLAVMVCGATVGRNRIIVKKVELASEKLPASFDGYRIAMFSDLHIGNLGKSSTLTRRMVDKINELDPDIVINGGDIVNMDARELDDKYISILSGIRAKDGVYSVLGNHDLGVYMRHESITNEHNLQILHEGYREMGWNLLRNETAYVERGHDSIAVTGIDYPLTGHSSSIEGYKGADIAAALNGVAASTYDITISHTPLEWDEILKYGISDLTLSGHVHAMQLKIGFGKWVWSPAMLMYDRWSGLYTENGRHLYINDGMGYVMYPMRVNANPEITLFILHSKP